MNYGRFRRPFLMFELGTLSKRKVYLKGNPSTLVKVLHNEGKTHILEVSPRYKTPTCSGV